jgi:hypothetical protein
LRRSAFFLAVIALLVGLGVAAGLVPRRASEPPWAVRRTTDPRRTGVIMDPRVRESSGVAASRAQPGVLWTLNDSGDNAWIYAIDTLGRLQGAFEVVGARNFDWEAISLGPCARRDCLYIADTGDNAQDRKTATIYRVAEPALSDAGGRTQPAQALKFRYPRGSPDVEALFVDPRGAITLISKGRGAPPTVYRLEPEIWEAKGLATAEKAEELSIDTGGLGNWVTDAALSPSGTIVAVRTYVAIYLFERSEDPPLRGTGILCDAAGLQLQGEGLTWLNERELALTSEGGFGTQGTVVVLGCGPGY